MIKKNITDIVLDASGIRIYESGESKKEEYGGHHKWRKLHAAIDLKTKEIVFSKLTRLLHLIYPKLTKSWDV